MLKNGLISLIATVPLLLAGCAEPRVAKTNCWSGAGTDTTVSTKGSNLLAGAGDDVAPCH